MPHYRGESVTGHYNARPVVEGAQDSGKSKSAKCTPTDSPPPAGRSQGHISVSLWGHRLTECFRLFGNRAIHMSKSVVLNP